MWCAVRPGRRTTRARLAGRIGAVGLFRISIICTLPRRALHRVAWTLVGALLATAPALAQFNLPRANTALPGSIAPPPSAPGAGPPPVAAFPPNPMLPPPDTRGLPGVDARECGPTAHHALCARGRWTLFSSIEVRVAAPGFSGAYTMEILQNNEVRATYRETANGKTRSGEVMLVGMNGIVYRTQEKFPADTAILDTMISAPIMTAQLASVLLDQGVIGPPSDVTGTRTIKASSDTQYLRAAAPNAAVLFAPPWRMSGTVRPGKTKSDIGFAMTLTYRPVDAKGVPVAGRADSLKLEGNVNFVPRREALPDTLDLRGYSVLRNDTAIEGQPNVAAVRKAITP